MAEKCEDIYGARFKKKLLLKRGKFEFVITATLDKFLAKKSLSKKVIINKQLLGRGSRTEGMDVEGWALMMCCTELSLHSTFNYLIKFDTYLSSDR